MTRAKRAAEPPDWRAIVKNSGVRLHPLDVDVVARLLETAYNEGKAEGQRKALGIKVHRT